MCPRLLIAIPARLPVGPTAFVVALACGFGENATAVRTLATHFAIRMLSPRNSFVLLLIKRGAKRQLKDEDGKVYFQGQPHFTLLPIPFCGCALFFLARV